MRHILSELHMQKCPCVHLAQLLVPCSSPGPFFPAVLRGCVVSPGHSKWWHRNHSSSGHWDTRSAMNQLEGTKLTPGFLGGRQTT